MTNHRFVVLLLVGYSIGVIAWTLCESVTGGKYRAILLAWGVLVGVIVGAAIESRACAESTAGSHTSFSARVLSRASIYVLPLVFSDSILVLTHTFPQVWGVATASYMLLVQAAVLVYLWKKHLFASSVSGTE